MKREILYRGLSLCRGEGWVYGHPRHYAKNPQLEKWTIYEPDTGIETDVVEASIGQYTGLTDKNGTKIFEGDIVKVTSLHYDTLGKECIVKVLYHRGCFWASRMVAPYVKQSLSYVELENDIEVVGNIYDNPEILKGYSHEQNT